MSDQLSAADAFEQQRPYLQAIAYRMLGTLSDAEDAVQDAYLHWARADRAAVRSPRAFLVTVLVRLCLDQLRSARSRREVYVGPWLPEPLATDSRPDLTETVIMRESLSLAFLLLLESLNPLERAVFLLREVFDYDYPEIARMVERSEASCRQLFHRARQHLAERRSRYETTAEQQARVTEQFVEASRTGDVQRLLSLLTEDAVLTADGGGKVPGAGTRPIYTRERIVRGFLGNLFKYPPDRAWVQEINGQPAVLATRSGQLYAVLSLVTQGGRITALFIVANPDKLRPLARQLGLA